MAFEFNDNIFLVGTSENNERVQKKMTSRLKPLLKKRQLKIKENTYFVANSDMSLYEHLIEQLPDEPFYEQFDAIFELLDDLKQIEQSRVVIVDENSPISVGNLNALYFNEKGYPVIHQMELKEMTDKTFFNQYLLDGAVLLVGSELRDEQAHTSYSRLIKHFEKWNSDGTYQSLNEALTSRDTKETEPHEKGRIKKIYDEAEQVHEGLYDIINTYSQSLGQARVYQATPSLECLANMICDLCQVSLSDDKVMIKEEDEIVELDVEKFLKDLNIYTRIDDDRLVAFENYVKQKLNHLDEQKETTVDEQTDGQTAFQF